MGIKLEATPFPIAETSLPKADPCVIVIFGALGDLATRKLVPALFRLAGAGCLSSRFKVLGVARRQINDEEYRERMRAGVAGSKEAGEVSGDEVGGANHLWQLLPLTAMAPPVEFDADAVRDEIENQWRLITPILEAWANQQPPEFPNYAAGSEGPAEADELPARNGHRRRP